MTEEENGAVWDDPSDPEALPTAWQFLNGMWLSWRIVKEQGGKSRLHAYKVNVDFRELVLDHYRLGWLDRRSDARGMLTDVREFIDEIERELREKGQI